MTSEEKEGWIELMEVMRKHNIHISCSEWGDVGVGNSILNMEEYGRLIRWEDIKDYLNTGDVK